jgi:NAD(P)-dependent dehydrogenase (short-subunit alcohol dehydrogenase family)
MQSYTDKVVVITGSGSGIGFALAKRFGLDGAKVVVSDVSSEHVQAAIADLGELGVDVAGCACDVTSRSEVEALADFARSTHGSVDVLVNNAGIGQVPTPLLDVDLEDFRRVHEVNLYGVLNGIQVFGRIFLEQGTPAGIYNLGSENSIYPCVPMSHAYVSSKHAVLAVTELLAEELPDFVEVALIMPGLVDSAMTRQFFRGMNTDEFASKVMTQLKAGEFYVVSHAYNRVRLEERYAGIAAAYDKYAPRYEGDDEYDIRTLVQGKS